MTTTRTPASAFPSPGALAGVLPPELRTMLERVQTDQAAAADGDAALAELAATLRRLEPALERVDAIAAAVNALAANVDALTTALSGPIARLGLALVKVPRA